MKRFFPVGGFFRINRFCSVHTPTTSGSLPSAAISATILTLSHLSIRSTVGFFVSAVRMSLRCKTSAWLWRLRARLAVR
jgi:hypothetical protein